MSWNKEIRHSLADLDNHANQLNSNHLEYDHSRESGSVQIDGSFQISDESTESVDSKVRDD